MAPRGDKNVKYTNILVKMSMSFTKSFSTSGQNIGLLNCCYRIIDDGNGNPAMWTKTQGLSF